METWYRVKKHVAEIKTVEADSSTEKTITLKSANGFRSRRVNKVGDYECYFATEDEAAQYLINRTHEDVMMIKKKLYDAEVDMSALLFVYPHLKVADDES